MKYQHTTILKRVILIAIIQFMIKEIVHPHTQLLFLLHFLIEFANKIKPNNYLHKTYYHVMEN